jgi:hypothetical protein
MPNNVSVGVAFSDPVLSGATVDNSVIGGTVPAAASFTTSYATQEIGYGTAAQTAVTQATSKSTGVTANTSAGQITMNAASLAATTNVTFTLTNSLLSAKDVIIVNVASANATAGAYNCWVSSMLAGSATITLRNITAGSLSEAVVINFAIVHAA